MNSILMSQASTSKEISQIRNAMKWFNKEMGNMKAMLSEILKVDVSRPSGPSGQETGPPGPAEAIPPTEVSEQESSQARQQVEEVEPSGLILVDPAGPSLPQAVQKESIGPVISKDVQYGVVEPAVAPEAPEPSSLATPAPPSPPSSSTAPQAPPTFKQLMPRTISSPTPFPSQSPFSSTSSPIIPPPPTVIANPPASSSAGASSSSGSSSSRPSSTLTSRSFIHPPTPPSSITFIPRSSGIRHWITQRCPGIEPGAKRPPTPTMSNPPTGGGQNPPVNPQLASDVFTQVEDEFERSTLTSVLAVASHGHSNIKFSMKFL
ncbi:hypothetical protein Taro_055156 [Colocasia esculenta]|uniref:Uncharacterized protein n=1 Tax=Colocasia esculenta TaxID=4460 RepID=A0A843XQA8_COLES|nr:hypothetical protein [Colocasia esculenta]